MTTEEKRKQVANQCRVVAHLATVLAGVRADYVKIIESGHMDRLLDQIGDETARQMEDLGDIINGMDAVDEEDEWENPIFKEAQQLWPQRRKDCE
jgi:hypothetical protein